VRRREPVVELGDGPPAELLRFRYAEWADELERPPPGRENLPFPSWHHIRAWRRFLDARKSWAATAGLNYVETFRPEWNALTDHPKV
jgi:hypothetical protein